MKTVLWLAAAYNLLWGAWVIVAPMAAFELAHLPLPLYPEFWQLAGAIVALLGIGYAIAATNPMRHWPLVLLGLLEKLVEPVAFIEAAAHGRIPWAAGWTMAVNDLLWAVPFALILRRTYQRHVARLRAASPEVLSLALRVKTDAGVTLDHMSRLRPVMVVFLRHTGCTFCREALADLAAQRRRIEASGASMVLVHMGTSATDASFFRRNNLDDIPRISDPGCNLYRAFGLQRGRLTRLFAPGVWWRGIVASLRHGFGRPTGDPFQMPGVFLLFHGQVIRSYRHHTPADRPDYVRFVEEQQLSSV